MESSCKMEMKILFLAQLCVSIYCSSSIAMYTSVDQSPRQQSPLIEEVSVAEHQLEDGGGRYRRNAQNDSMETSMPPAPGTPSPADTVIVEDGHSYYNSTYYSNGQQYFIDMMNTDDKIVNVHNALSRTHLTAGEVSLPFQFPFYGHNLTKVYIATGGFLSLSTFFHQHLSATQYIAPLMGNFDPSLNDSSRIRYGYNDTSFTVEWDDIHVQHVQAVGRFTFQTTLLSDGRIIFAYGKISSDVDEIRGGNGHKVTVGLADGYYIDKPLYPGSLLIQRTIYHYHNVQLNETLVKGGAAFVLEPLPTCNLFRSCSECLEMRATIQFDCGWCSKIGRCSSGFDRHRQDWLDGDCPENAQEECHNPVLRSTVVPPQTSTFALGTRSPSPVFVPYGIRIFNKKCSQFCVTALFYSDLPCFVSFH